MSLEGVGEEVESYGILITLRQNLHLVRAGRGQHIPSLCWEGLPGPHNVE